MKRAIILLTLIVSLLSSFSASAQTKKVAVYVTGAIEPAKKSIVSSSILARISGNKDFVPFERNEQFVNALFKEHSYQQSGEVAEHEIRQSGQKFAVDYVIAANVVIDDENQCYMSARLINLNTGEIVKSANINRLYTGTKVLSTMATNLAYRLTNKNSK